MRGAAIVGTQTANLITAAAWLGKTVGMTTPYAAALLGAGVAGKMGYDWFFKKKESDKPKRK
jgi:hypothetical protein